MRDPFPWPPFARAGAPGGVARLRRGLPSRDRRAGRARRPGSAGRRDGGAPAGDRHHPDVVADADADGDGRRRGAGAIGRQARARHRNRPGRPGRARPAPRAGRGRSVACSPGRPSRSMAGRSRLSLVPRIRVPIWISALGPRAMRAGGGDRGRRPAELVHARARAASASSAAAGGRGVGRARSGGRDGRRLRPGEPGSERRGLRATRCRRLRASTRRTRRTLASSRSWGSGAMPAGRGRARVAGRPEDVPEDLVRAVAWSASPSQARERLEGYREAGRRSSRRLPRGHAERPDRVGRADADRGRPRLTGARRSARARTRLQLLRSSRTLGRRVCKVDTVEKG